MSHTPGPWVAVADGIVSGKTGQVVCVFTRGFPGDRSECAANERLIKAAPDLLAALKKMAGQHGAAVNRTHKDGCGCAYCVAHRAIRLGERT